MAEIAVNHVINKLIPLLKDKKNLPRGVHGQLTFIKDQLQLIQAYLNDADRTVESINLDADAERKRPITQMPDASDRGIEAWVYQMWEVCVRIEDAIDTYLYNVANNHPLRHRAVGVVCKICDLKNVMPHHYPISSQIGEIRETIKKLISQARILFSFITTAPKSRSHGNASLHYLRHRTNCTYDDDELVGVDHTMQQLMDWLLEEGNRSAISVVGEGGLGKTTIVRHVYNKQKQGRSFDCFAWVTVSDSLVEKHLLKTLLQNFYEEAGHKILVKKIDEMDDDAIIGKLREDLQGRRYMIVFDDLGGDQWRDIESALPRDNGKIIIINEQIAEFSRGLTEVHIHKLQPLHSENALKLFHLKAFQFDQGGCPEELKSLSKNFVEKCDGVPLAIVAIASLLTTKDKTVLEWQKVYDSIVSNFYAPQSVDLVLTECYYDLGYHLKACLLYFGLFPKNYSITCTRLFNLWIAEGFVEDKEDQGQTLEEVAEEYLAELIARRLVEVAKLYSDGRIKSCQVHDLMHDFIDKKCKDLDFLQLKDNVRLHLNGSSQSYVSESSIIHDGVPNDGRMRSYIVSNIKDMSNLIESWFSRFKLLIILDFEGVPLGYLPEAVGKLFNLKYLNLRGTKIKTIPKFIGKLQNLETLDLRLLTFVTTLPKEINTLIKLRFLLIDRLISKEGIEHLRALHRLSWLHAGDDGDNIIKELMNLKQMRRLGICDLIRNNGKSLCSAIESMIHLCSLKIIARSDVEVLDLESLNDPPPQLQHLYLRGCLEKLPNWIPKLKNLTVLKLNMSRLKEDPLPLLRMLSELLVLQLWGSYEGLDLHFQEGWFMKLEILIVFHMRITLKMFKIDEGGLPQLQELRLFPPPEMVQVPTNIQKLVKYRW